MTKSACGTGLGCTPGGDEAGDVRHVDEEIGADLAGDLAHALEVDDARVGGGADGDQRGLEFARGFFELVVVDALVFWRDAVVGDLVEAAGEIRLVAVGEVAAVGEVHGEDLVAGLEHGEVDGGVRLRAGVRLDVGVLRAEELLGAVDGELLDDVDVFAAAIPAAAGVALGVFVGEHGALRLHHGGRGEVFRGDQLDVVALAALFGRRWRRRSRDRSAAMACGMRRLIELADAALVAAAFEGGDEEGIDHGVAGFGVGVLRRRGRGRSRRCAGG